MPNIPSWCQNHRIFDPNRNNIVNLCKFWMSLAKFPLPLNHSCIFMHWFIASLNHRFIDSSIHWIIDSLIHSFVEHWFIDSLAHWFIDAVVHCFIHSVVHGFFLVISLASQPPKTTFADAPHNFNRSGLLHLKSVPIGQWFLIVISYVETSAPARAGHYLVWVKI